MSSTQSARPPSLFPESKTRRPGGLITPRADPSRGIRTTRRGKRPQWQLQCPRFKERLAIPSIRKSGYKREGWQSHRHSLHNGDVVVPQGR